MYGGNWNNGVNCGPRTVNLNNYAWNVNTNIGSRLACDTLLLPKKRRSYDYGHGGGGI
jgi:hypothetical protein